MNKIVAGALAILVLLVAFTLFFSGLSKKAGVSTQTAPTPIPTKTFEVKSQPFYNNTWERNYRPVATDSLPDSRQQALDELKTKLPFENDKFAIDYSPFLNQFFVNKKTPDADGAIDAFLQENNALDLKEEIGRLFIETNETPRIAILKAEDQMASRLQEEGGLEDIEVEAQTTKKTQVDYLEDSGKTLLSFNFGGPKKDQPAGKTGGGSANCTNASGNVRIACEALNLLGFPYANGTEGVPIRFAGHPPGPWVDARNAGDARFKYLDCSGLTSVAVFKAMGGQNPGLHGRNYCSGTYLNDKANFRRLGSLREIKPGDLVIKGTACGNNGHVAVVVSYDGNNTMEVVEAYSHKAPSARRTHRLNSGSFNSAVRYVGPGATP